MYLEIDRNSRNPIRNQLYEQLLKRILSGELQPGTQMPSSRYLHEKLNLSRNLILEAYEQLSAEGYLEGRHGKGTWVSQSVVMGSYRDKIREPLVKQQSGEGRKDIVNFCCGIPDLSRFPVKKWKRSIDYAWSLSGSRQYSYPPVNGIESLRIEIADYLLLTKGIHASPDCIVITSGTSESLFLLASHFAAYSKQLIIEDPVVDFAASVFSQSGYHLQHVPVDTSGIDVDRLPEKPQGKLVFVSPSHQFPLGVVLPGLRRVALVDYAARHNMYIIEDDYDSEFRYEGQPLRSLFLMNPEAVIHAGTFSKNMIPALRLGYLVIPEQLVHAVLQTKEQLNMRTNTEIQMAMAHFMQSGAFVRHIALMKRIYRRRYEFLLNELQSVFGNDLVVQSNAAGMHLYLSHRNHEFSTDDCAAFEQYGVIADCVAAYSSTKEAGGLLLGFGNLAENRISEGVIRLHRAIDAMHTK